MSLSGRNKKPISALTEMGHYLKIYQELEYDMDNIHFSSKTDQWATPISLFTKLDALFNFKTDVCADADNAKCELFYTEQVNGLDQEWSGVCWMNPPYGRSIGDWVKKAYQSSLDNGATVVCLLPARPDTRWWHDYCVKGEMFFLKGRLKFGDAKNSAPFPSAIVVFRPSIKDVLNGFSA